MENEQDFIYLRNHLGHWYYIPDSEEDTFNRLLETYILTGNPSKFLKEFKDYRITSREEHKRSNLNK